MDFQVPELGEGVYEAEFLDWKVKVGDTVRRGQSLMEVMTDKATMEVPAPFAGTITALRAEPSQKIKVGDSVLSYTPAGQPATKDTAPAAEPARKEPVPLAAAMPEPARRNGPTVPASRPDLLVKAAPSVRLMARKMGIDLTRVHGSGPQGRILIDDLSAALTAGAAPLRPAAAAARADYGVPGSRIKLQGLRRRIAERMVQSKQTIPHYTYVDECDVTALVGLRESLREPFDRAGIKLTYLPFFVKAVVLALKEVPIVNASLDEAAGEIVLHDHYHIGIAAATPGGLIVPVVQDADKKDLVQIAQEIDRLSADARVGKSRREDLRGGTFTITSIGSIGGLIATPIINPPEVGILGIGKVVKRPVFDAAGQVKPADLVYLSFSFDHRVLDGAVGAVFGNAVIRHLQQPAALLLPEKLGRSAEV
jgi:pyruvate dehydrogenase E2 component (dihydrolipoamide acetyltransferase)/2-oxoisovalerate dehydrogenase E2 component (dihydrolipoyl transacylase)